MKNAISLNSLQSSDDVLKRIFLLSTKKSNPIGLQLLDDKFVPTIDKLRREGKTLQECIVELNNMEQYFKGQSQSVHGNGRSRVNKVHHPLSEKNGKSDSDIKCHNCQNIGHMSNQCQSNFCGNCHRFDCGHQYHNCPRRNKSTPAASKRKRYNDPSEDEEEEEEEEEEETPPVNKKSKNNAGKGKNAKPPATKVPKEQIKGNKNAKNNGKQNARFSRVKTIVVNRVHDANGKLFKTSITKRTEDMSVPVCLDSGADDHIVNDRSLLNREYRNTKIPTLVTANGDEMHAEAVGSMNKVMTKAIFVPESVDNLASVSKMQAKGCWTIFPPTDGSVEFLDPRIGALIVLGKTGKVIGVANRDMMFDAEDFGEHHYEHLSVTLPLIKNRRQK